MFRMCILFPFFHSIVHQFTIFFRHKIRIFFQRERIKLVFIDREFRRCVFSLFFIPFVY